MAWRQHGPGGYTLLGSRQSLYERVEVGVVKGRAGFPLLHAEPLSGRRRRPLLVPLTWCVA
jgi:hypothetical protein